MSQRNQRRKAGRLSAKFICKFLTLAFAFLPHLAPAQTLSLPPRPADAPTGQAFAESISSLDRPEREARIFEQVALGNVPNFLRHLCPVQVESVLESKTNSATYYVAPDYLAVGSDTNYFLTPLTPITAQKIADLLYCSLPTRKMVNDIYSAAEVKLAPSPTNPTAAMITVPVFLAHNRTVLNQRRETLAHHPFGALVAGDKKDIVITARLATETNKVAIYGWHFRAGAPIQPLYTGHVETWADYSHGIRLVQSSLTVNGSPKTIPEVLADPALCSLLSDEGPVLRPRYPTNFSVSTNHVLSTASTHATSVAK